MNRTEKPKALSMNVIGRRKIWYLISLLIIIPGLLSLIFRGFNLGIDFTGGNLLQIAFTQEVTAEQISEVVAEFTPQTPSVQSADNNSFIIRSTGLTEETSAGLVAALQSSLGAGEPLRNESVGSVIGGELRNNALIALLLAMALMLVYISFRFKLNFALAAILALAHDVLVMVSMVSLLQIEINSFFIASILTIIGYSINSTIVIFDRIRENSDSYKKEELSVRINTAVRQTLTRSINTNVAVMLLLAALLFFGGATTRDFIFTLVMGVVAGAFSSIFLAGSFLFEITSLRNKLSAGKAARAKAAK